MKRLVFWYFLFFACFATAENQAEQNQIDAVDNCHLQQILATVWKKHPLGENEGGAWILKEQGRLKKIDWVYTPQRRQLVWDDVVPENVIAQVHTHGDNLDPKPSGPDIQLARKLKMPIYVLTRKAIWRAQPDGSVEQIATRKWYKEASKPCEQELVQKR